jgi:DNA helicase-2/ATP-dependent DNA helicase PcrA
MALQSNSDLEEERRLFYVATTRAEKQTILSYAERRFRYGNLVFCEPSRFIYEIDAEINPEYFDWADKPKEKGVDYNGGGETTYQKNYTKTSNIDLIKPKQASPVLKRNLVSTNKINTQAAPVDAQAIKSIKEGTQVQHDKFGNGTVLAIEGDFPNIKATIQFDLGGQKQLLLKYAKLKVIS